MIRYVRMPIEVESPEEFGYDRILFNLAESSIADQSLASLGLTIPNLTLLYNDHRGAESLRALIAAETAGCAARDVLVTTGAASALFIVATALLSADDHIVVVRPNYATNLETPKAIGCRITFIDLTFEDEFRLPHDALVAAITPKTKLISVTCPHNPTGVMLSLEELQSLAALAARHGCRLLVDETYRDLSLDNVLPVAASLGPQVISVSSLSKAYGVPGIRLGWIITQDPALQELFLAAKEQISISGSVIDEWVGEQVLGAKTTTLPLTLAEMRLRRQSISDWVAGEDLVEWIAPEGGVVCFPRISKEPKGGYVDFYDRLIRDHGAYVGPGHWFEMSDRFFRLGYGWPSATALKGGLEAISAALRGGT